MRLFSHILRFAFTASLLAYCAFSYAQSEKGISVSAESMKSLIRDGQQMVRYLKNVNILHQGAIMTCDSAYLNKKKGIIEAFNNVVVTKEDTKLYGDYLIYDENVSSGKITGKIVKLVQNDASLVTDIIYFNTKLNSAYYLTSGTLTNKDNKLISQRGYYYSKSKKYNFAGLVEMEGKDGRLYTDSLEYNTLDENVYFFGPTRIYNKKNYIYCEKGWYNRKTNVSNFFKNAFIDNGSKKLYGQDIFYDKSKGFAKVVDNVAIVDTANKLTVYGGKATYCDSTKFAEVDLNPLMVMVSGNDTLFLKSEKFLVNSIPDNSLPDSLYRIIKALGKVAFFKKDLQGHCDSLLYNTKDSTISLFVEPVLWSDNNQITADFIKGYTGKGNKIRRMDFDGNAFSTSIEDSLNFNQIRGKSMIASFTEGQLTKLDVKGNGQAVYYLRDEGIIAAANKAEGTDLTVTFKNSKISKISFKIKPISAFYPIKKVDYDEITLKGFHWLESSRPKSKFDIIPKGLDLILTDEKPGFQRDLKKTLLTLPEDKKELVE